METSVNLITNLIQHNCIMYGQAKVTNLHLYLIQKLYNNKFNTVTINAAKVAVKVTLNKLAKNHTILIVNNNIYLTI